MKLKNFMLKTSLIICSFAFFVAVNSVDKIMCIGSFYQPKVPASLEKYRNHR